MAEVLGSMAEVLAPGSMAEVLAPWLRSMAEVLGTWLRSWYPDFMLSSVVYVRIVPYIQVPGLIQTDSPVSRTLLLASWPGHGGYRRGVPTRPYLLLVPNMALFDPIRAHYGPIRPN